MGFTPQHDYSLFETRAARGELLPDEDDRVLLELEREDLDFELHVGPGLRHLVDQALARPGEPARGTVGDLMRLEVTTIAVAVDRTELVDLTIVVRLPQRRRAPLSRPTGLDRSCSSASCKLPPACQFRCLSSPTQTKSRS
ncbi:MAG TPA: hypothetical protein VME20_00925 [Acidimicrobiales bacterium]|nr:hypothetical protein [Acidimicrobiales bacterium]